MRAPDNKIYLASKSPRRRELLRQIGVEFELLMLRDLMPRGADVDEHVLPNESAQAYVARVTQDKAAFAQRIMHMRRLPERPILAADTTVVLGEQILGKPADAAEAAHMLRMLSGHTHQVITCVTVQFDSQAWHATQTSEVSFHTLSEQTIETYCAGAEPYDKAGAYGIQGMAAMFIREIRGSYSGIMGLPLFETAQLLQQAGMRIL
jgi:septum formation protein